MTRLALNCKACPELGKHCTFNHLWTLLQYRYFIPLCVCSYGQVCLIQEGVKWCWCHTVLGKPCTFGHLWKLLQYKYFIPVCLINEGVNCWWTKQPFSYLAWQRRSSVVSKLNELARTPNDFTAASMIQESSQVVLSIWVMHETHFWQTEHCRTVLCIVRCSMTWYDSGHQSFPSWTG